MMDQRVTHVGTWELMSQVGSAARPSAFCARTGGLAPHRQVDPFCGLLTSVLSRHGTLLSSDNSKSG